MWKQLLVSVLFMPILLFLFPAQALASPPPTTTTTAFRDVFTLPCDGFELFFDDPGTFRVTTYYNDDGTERRFTAHLVIDGTVRDSRTGAIYKDNARVTTSGNLPADDNLETSRGVFLSINVPGHGVVNLVAGRITRNEDHGDTITFVSGKGLVDQNDQGLSVLCDDFARL
jgi:hypothetical protein